MAVLYYPHGGPAGISLVDRRSPLCLSRITTTTSSVHVPLSVFLAVNRISWGLSDGPALGKRKTTSNALRSPPPPTKLFKGNTDGDNIRHNIFEVPIIAQWVRINPTRWRDRISLRAELYGCDYSEWFN